MEYQEDNNDRKRKIRIIAGTCVVAILVLGVGAWLIISAVSGINGDSASVVSQTAPENNTRASSTSKDSTKNTSGATGSSTGSNSSDGAASASDSASSAASESTSDSSAGAATATSSSTAATGADNGSATSVPATGPTEVLASALLIGAAVYLFLLNRDLAKHAA